MNSTRYDATERGVPSGDILFANIALISSKNEIKMKYNITPDAPKNENGLILVIKMRKFIRHVG